jgi:hypothetical protein
MMKRERDRMLKERTELFIGEMFVTVCVVVRVVEIWRMM